MHLVTTYSAGEGAPHERENVKDIRSRPTAQILIIGGGINGIATFRDLAFQGIDVVLVERNDYASGASAASSHMIHGGIRYLENGEFRLVREAVNERNGLLTIAPHYVSPLTTTVPIFSLLSGIVSAPLRFLTHKHGKPKERGALLIKVGLTLYDSFSRDGGNVPRHRFLGRKKSFAELPHLNPDVKYTATYCDASVHEPERLALDVLKDGFAAGVRARCANYLEAVGVAGGGVVLQDRETGVEFTFTAPVVINASGPWTDLTNRALGDETRYMGGTKGSHIVVDNAELLAATDGRELFFENDDGRIVLIYPLKGRVLIGTTDLEADVKDLPVCTEEEIDYFFRLVAHVYPTISLDRSHIVYRYAGIRPLPHHDDLQPGFVSRDYRIVPTTHPALPETTVLSLVGGKWTTFRALSEHLANEALKVLGVARTASTVGMPIGGGRDFPRTSDARSRWVAEYSGMLDSARVVQLLERYGTRASEVIDAIIATGMDAPLTTTSDLTTGEIAYFVTREDVVHLTDVVLRRTNLAFTGELTGAILDELAGVLGGILGWSNVQREAEIAGAREELLVAHGVRLEVG